jgi:CMP-N,N'-diacetyllegionaminic acid synthase
VSPRALEVLALIAARSGSKGLRSKNIRRVGGMPLLVRAIKLAHDSVRPGEHWSIVVSTDSRRYAALALAAGAEIPFLRPAALARDNTRLITVVQHALASLATAKRRFDVVVLLSAATPLTRQADVRAALRLWQRSGRAAVISVGADTRSPSWLFGWQSGRLTAPAARRVERRQRGPKRFVANGAIHIATPAWIERHGQFFAPGRTRGFLMPPERCLDIETAHDLKIARLLLDRGRRDEARRCPRRQIRGYRKIRI